ncbi:MAG: hypothetical protein HY696_01310 [Deltaproteobacteria bacterium]|nr:hypothetical protein [Deltaproteobacteria bacterium]
MPGVAPSAAAPTSFSSQLQCWSGRCSSIAGPVLLTPDPLTSGLAIIGIMAGLFTLVALPIWLWSRHKYGKRADAAPNGAPNGAAAPLAEDPKAPRPKRPERRRPPRTHAELQPGALPSGAHVIHVPPARPSDARERPGGPGPSGARARPANTQSLETPDARSARQEREAALSRRHGHPVSIIAKLDTQDLGWIDATACAGFPHQGTGIFAVVATSEGMRDVRISAEGEPDTLVLPGETSEFAGTLKVQNLAEQGAVYLTKAEARTMWKMWKFHKTATEMPRRPGGLPTTSPREHDERARAALPAGAAPAHETPVERAHRLGERAGGDITAIESLDDLHGMFAAGARAAKFVLVERPNGDIHLRASRQVSAHDAADDDEALIAAGLIFDQTQSHRILINGRSQGYPTLDDRIDSEQSVLAAPIRHRIAERSGLLAAQGILQTLFGNTVTVVISKQ